MLSTLTSEQQALLQQFQQGDFHTRWEVGKSLARIGPVFIPALGQLLTFDATHPELDWFIARLLGEFNHPAAIPALTRLLQHPDADVQTQAAGAFAQLGSLAISALQVQLADPQTCLLAVQALNQIDDDQIIPLLIEVVTSNQPDVREMALAALSRFVCGERMVTLSPFYLSALEDPDPRVRATAVNTLGRVAANLKSGENLSEKYTHKHGLAAGVSFGLPNWADLFAARLWDVNLAVAQQAALALGHLGTDAATAALQSRLTSPAAPVLLIKMIRALAWIATPAAIAALAQIWQSQAEPFVYQEIATVLGRISGASQPLAAQLLLELLEQAQGLSPAVKQAIVHSLGSLGQPQTLDALIALLADPHPGVQLHVIAALKQLNPTLGYQSLQAKFRDPSLSPALHQGLALAIREW